MERHHSLYDPGMLSRRQVLTQVKRPHAVGRGSGQ
jgi:hypothetical protein